jgi:hypothetical protein
MLAELQQNNKYAPETNMVPVATPSRAHTTNTDRPAGVLGEGSPYPIVVNAIKPKHHVASQNQAFRGNELERLTEIYRQAIWPTLGQTKYRSANLQFCQIIRYTYVGNKDQARMRTKLTNQNTTNNVHAKDERITRTCVSLLATIESKFTFTSSLLEVVSSVVELPLLC